MHPMLSPLEQLLPARANHLAVADQSLQLSYAAFAAVSAGLAGQIAAATKRARVGVLAPTSAACAVGLFACWRAGKVPVPLNFLLSAEELGRVIADAGLDLVVTIEHFAEGLRAAGRNVLVLNAQTMVPGRMPAPPAAQGDVAVVIYTSGTSGDPKGVVLSYDNIVSNARSCIEHARMDPDQVFFSVIPQFHSFGFTAMTVVPLLLGATVWYQPRFSPLAILNTIAEKQVTIFMAVASMYAALARVKQAPEGALASLHLAISGGEPLMSSVAGAFQQRFGVEIMEGYGQTETSPVVAFNLPWKQRRGSVGVALPGVEVWAQGTRGERLAAGQDGELLIRGHCVMQGYLNKPDATAAVLHDKVLRTGDVGHVDPEGFVFITGRAKEMLIIGGENVFPREIESVLLEHPAVSEAAVIGVRDALRGELPVAFAILKEGAEATPVELREFCRSKLAGYKVPREVHIEPDLPRGPTGKILKRSLKPR